MLNLSWQLNTQIYQRLDTMQTIVLHPLIPTHSSLSTHFDSITFNTGCCLPGSIAITCIYQSGKENGTTCILGQRPHICQLIASPVPPSHLTLSSNYLPPIHPHKSVNRILKWGEQSKFFLPPPPPPAKRLRSASFALL